MTKTELGYTRAAFMAALRAHFIHEVHVKSYHRVVYGDIPHAYECRECGGTGKTVKTVAHPPACEYTRILSQWNRWVRPDAD